MQSPLVLPTDDSQDEALQSLVSFYEETLGFCPNSIKTMYHRPAIAHAFIELNKAVMANHGRVTSALKRLIGYVASHAAGCRYCQAHTIRAAERYGAEEEQLLHIWDFEQHPAFSEAERVALRFALAAAAVPNAVDEVLAAKMRQYWNEGEIVEILGVVALFGYLNRWNDSMATTLEPGALLSAEQWLGAKGWQVGKHQA
jgi:uncharacterized peroxidase-related enzyme